MSRDTKPLLFSVIIPVLNEEKIVGHCLSALAAQSLTVNEFEVIVVDNGSTDRTIEIASEYHSALRLTIIRKPACNISAARNAAADIAKGTFLAFLDADCLPSEEWLRRALIRLRSGDGGVVGSFYTVPPKSTWVAKTWYGDLPQTRQGPVSYVPSGTLFVARSVFLSVGGFDHSIQTSEDFEFCQRVKGAGYQVLGCSELSTIHLGTPQTIAAFYRKQRWHGTGVRSAFNRNMLDRNFAKTILHTVYVCACMFLGLVTIPVALLTYSPLVLALAPCLFLSGSLLVAGNAARQRRKWSLLPALTVLYMAYGLARSVSLMGIGGGRDPRVLQPYSTRASSSQTISGSVPTAQS